MADPESFVTPEAVVLDRDVAGLGTRFIGALVDTTVQTLVLLVAVAASSGMGPDGQVILLSVTGILLVFGYPAAMETVTRGRTLGKMAARTRVVRTDGSPVTFAPVLVRNLVRIVDLLPGAYAVGAISILVTPRGQRLGDLAAGTVVVYDVRGRVPEPVVLGSSSEHENARRGMDAAGLSPREYGVVRAFLARRNSLEPAARAHLAADLQARLRDRVGTADPDASPEVFLEALVAAYRERHQR